MDTLCGSALLVAPAIHAAVRTFTALHRLHALSLTADSAACVPMHHSPPLLSLPSFMAQR
jgi:hypothetical protein